MYSLHNDPMGSAWDHRFTLLQLFSKFFEYLLKYLKIILYYTFDRVCSNTVNFCRLPVGYTIFHQKWDPAGYLLFMDYLNYFLLSPLMNRLLINFIHLILLLCFPEYFTTLQFKSIKYYFLFGCPWSLIQVIKTTHSGNISNS
jgi:hypothetical protein